MLKPADYLERHAVALVAHKGAINVEPALVVIVADLLVNVTREYIPVDTLNPDQARDLYVSLAGFLDAYDRTGAPIPYWIDVMRGELARLRECAMMTDPVMSEPAHDAQDTRTFTPEGDETAGAPIETGIETPRYGMIALDDTAPSGDDGVTEFS